LIKNFNLNDDVYNETLYRVMVNAENLPRCEELHNKKNNLHEARPESVDALNLLDDLLSEYYKEVLQLMYREVVENIVKIFYTFE